jgi:transcriptional regulator with XRE-family HTH domain
VKAITSNSAHGKQLTSDEKRENAQRLFKAGITDLNKISSILSVELRTCRNWTQDLRKTADEKRDAQILDLYLQCYSIREIEEKLGVSDSTIDRVLQNGRLSEMKQPDSLQYYNVWTVFKLPPYQMRFPGQIPRQIIENIIYYYSDPPQLEPRLKFSKVVDPMAGSGVVRDACRNLLRRYMLFDIKPQREDLPILKNDILQGFPDRARGADLVFLDPPYFNLMAEDYPENEFTKDYPSFLGAMETSLRNIRTILNPNGLVSLILKPMNVEMLGGEWLDMTLKCVSIAEKQGYKLIKRYSAPLSNEQFGPEDVNRAKERRVTLNTLRDIVILQREAER